MIPNHILSELADRLMTLPNVPARLLGIDLAASTPPPAPMTVEEQDGATVYQGAVEFDLSFALLGTHRLRRCRAVYTAAFVDGELDQASWQTEVLIWPEKAAAPEWVAFDLIPLLGEGGLNAIADLVDEVTYARDAERMKN